MSNKVPIVAIVGRANVGKSSLFNTIIGYREAITASEPGTTRDSIMARASFKKHDFWLVDTAGYKEANDDFEMTIQDQIIQATDSADMIVVVVEADVMVTEEDRRVAKLALKSKKTTILVVNKVDKNRKVDLTHYLKLGIKPVFGTSTTQKTGINMLVDSLVKDLPKVKLKSPNSIKVALLGRPNVGKSQLFNALAKKQQAIVADRAGTTRDINRSSINYHNTTIELLDTAGIRKSGKIGVGVEKFSVLRSINAIEQADVCLLLLDVNELAVQLDQKIAGMVKEAGKGLVLVVSKWDALEKKDEFSRDNIATRIKREFEFSPWAPLIFTSSITGQNVTKIFDLVLEIHKNRQQKIKTPLLNKWLQEMIYKHPPSGLKNSQPKLNYIVQTNDETPTFQVFGRHTKLLHWSYKRYLEKQFRLEFGFEGTPLKYFFVEK
jgi:GTP-binding protein